MYTHTHTTHKVDLSIYRTCINARVLVYLLDAYLPMTIYMLHSHTQRCNIPIHIPSRCSPTTIMFHPPTFRWSPGSHACTHVHTHTHTHTTHTHTNTQRSKEPTNVKTASNMSEQQEKEGKRPGSMRVSASGEELVACMYTHTHTHTHKRERARERERESERDHTIHVTER